MLGALVALLIGMPGIPAAAAAGDAPGLVRIAHLSPDTPAVDVALAPLPASASAPLTDPGPDVATGLGYGDLSAFTQVAPGSYAVSLRAAGAGRDTPPVLTTRIEVTSGEARTLALTGLFADLALEPLTDDLSAPPAGSARVRVISAAGGVAPVDVVLAGGLTLATGLPPGGAAGAVVVPAGPATVQVDGGARLPVTWAAGSISTVLVLDAPGGGLTVRVVLDAAGPAVVPTGAVEAGGGGTAGLPAAGGAILGAATLLAAASRRARVLVVVAGAVLAAAPLAPAVLPAAERPARVVTLAAETHPSSAAPVRLQMPSAGVDTALTGIDLDAAGALVPPSENALAGWYRQGPAPGDAGPAVLTGHVDSVAGPAVFFRLRDVAVGDEVLVDRADGSTVAFTVSRVARYAKASFPAAEVYRPTAGAELRLITCGGAFDRSAHSYQDDVVVYAVLRTAAPG